MNFADDLFENVFESDQPEQAAELINDNGHAGMASAKLFEQFAGGFGFWNDEHFAQNAAQIEWRGRQIFGNQALTTLQNPEHILDMNEAENVIEGSAKNRNARALRGGECAQHLIESGFDAQDVHVRTGHHNFTYLNLAKLDGAEDNALFAGGEKAAFASLLNLDLQFFGGVRQAVTFVSTNAHGANDFCGSFIQEIDSPTERIQKPVKRPGDQESNAFRTSETDSLRNQFTNDNVQNREQDKRGSESQSVSQDGGTSSLDTRPKRSKEICESGFAEGAKSEAGESDAKLDAGNDAMQVGDEARDDFCARIAFGNKLTNARQAHRDQGEFRSGKESVENNQNNHADEANDKHAAGMLLSCIVSAETTAR